jgi:hypothetical protein
LEINKQNSTQPPKQLLSTKHLKVVGYEFDRMNECSRGSREGEREGQMEEFTVSK